MHSSYHALQMQAQSHSVHADPQIFTDGWDPQQWQQQQQQQQQQTSLNAPQLPQLYRPALAPPMSHAAFAAAVAAAGMTRQFNRVSCSPPRTLNPYCFNPLELIVLSDEGSSSEVARLRAANRCVMALQDTSLVTQYITGFPLCSHTVPPTTRLRVIPCAASA